MTNEESLNYIKENIKYTRAYSSAQDKKQFFKDWYDSVISKIPKKLYKYRECNELNINTLRDKKVWFADPEYFNDELDIVLNFDYASLDDALQNTMEMIYEPFLDLNERINKFANYEQDINKNAFYTNLKGLFLDKLSSKLNPSQLRSLCYVLCLCKRYDNKKMWNDYATKGTGFCIGYDIRKIPNKRYIDCLFPVYYGTKDSIDILDLMHMKKEDFHKGSESDEAIELCEKAIFTLCTKDEKWKDEEEWRFILFRKDVKDQRMDFKYAESLYLGENIDSINKKKLLDIASEQDLKVYQRKSLGESKWEYNEILITKSRWVL